MPTHALYDVLYSFKDIHKVVLGLAESLNDDQLCWRPEGYSTSIGFHLWHLARESDYLKAAILHHYPGLGDEVAASLPIPRKAELLSYLKNSYDTIEQFVEKLDTHYPDFANPDEDFQKKLSNIRLNLLVFLTHDCSHLGMMKCLKGLQTGFGSATEKR